MWYVAPPPLFLLPPGKHHRVVLTCFLISSGIFGYINYLVERDRQFIIDTLLNGMSPTTVLLSLKSGESLLI